MYYEVGVFWLLPCFVTIVLILLSLLVFKKWEIQNPTVGATGDTSSTNASPSPSPTSVTVSSPSPASASASDSASGGEYEVFLSFRGIDTRKVFTDFLYHDLLDAGIRTFRDDNELRVGEEIGPELLKAIKESKISIPIFSKNYASSKWCLRELAQTVECQKNLGHKIFPIFYDVEPSHVKDQTGSYEVAFRQHEKHLDEKTVQGWKKALTVVGRLKGLELEKETKGHEGELVKLVVSKVLLELKKNNMTITDNLVGIEHHVQEMMRLLDFDSNDVRIVGIHGMGGIGKTTIAKVIYNNLSTRFQSCCFLEDVRERSRQHKGLVDLQNQLISEIRKRKNIKVTDATKGANEIRDIVSRKKVFIGLDDLDDESQFFKLVGKQFGLESRIIVTTRNKGVLDAIGKQFGSGSGIIVEIYKPPFMEYNDSLKLFSKHAFCRDSPPKDFYNLSEQIVSTAAGLPLTLEIIGSLLYKKHKEIWEEALLQLKNKPNNKVEEKLRISYDTLEYEQKEIFLDIACFFVGDDQMYPIYMWEDCEFYPRIGIDVLVLRSLVKVGDDGKLMMHDELRRLGRQIVYEENPKEPGERSRLGEDKKALAMVREPVRREKVEALHIDIPRSEYDSFVLQDYQSLCFTREELAQLPNLRYLRLHVDFAGDFKHLLSKLRWLDWRGCLGNVAPTNFHLKNMIILNLSYSYIRYEWEGWSQIKMAKKLKVLDLSVCSKLTRTPDLSTLVALERLILRDCRKLVEIDPSIGNLINLRELDIENSGITQLPDRIGNLEKLEVLNASNCHNLEGEIPSSITRLSSLRILTLGLSKICSLPTSICELSRLQTLDLMWCRELLSLPMVPPSLTILKVTCKSMAGCLNLSNLEELSEITICSCRGLMEIQGLGKLQSLMGLDVFGCVDLAKLDGLEQLKNLRALLMSECESLVILPDMSNLTKLQRLDTSFCSRLTEIHGLDKLESLEKLDLSDCISLVRLPDMSNLKNLKVLDIRGSKKLTEIRGLEALESLELLNIGGCTLIEDLPDFSNLKKLKEIKAYWCVRLTEIRGLEELKSLKHLDISGCKSIIEKPPSLPNTLIYTDSAEARAWREMIPRHPG